MGDKCFSRWPPCILGVLAGKGLDRCLALFPTSPRAREEPGGQAVGPSVVPQRPPLELVESSVFLIACLPRLRIASGFSGPGLVPCLRSSAQAFLRAFPQITDLVYLPCLSFSLSPRSFSCASILFWSSASSAFSFSSFFRSLSPVDRVPSGSSPSFLSPRRRSFPSSPSPQGRFSVRPYARWPTSRAFVACALEMHRAPNTLLPRYW